MAPGASAGSSFFSNADVVAARICALDFPASTRLVFIRKMGRNVLEAAGLKQFGARTLAFQNSGSSVDFAQERSTMQTKPFGLFTDVKEPSRSSRNTSATSEIEGEEKRRKTPLSAFSYIIK